MMKTILLAWICGCLCAQAGRVSVLNLSESDPVSVELRAAGKTLKMELEAGGESGTLAPEGDSAEVVASVSGKETKVKVPTAGAGSVVVVRVGKDGPTCKIVASKPTPDHFSVRVCNLAEAKVEVKINGKAVAVPADGEATVPDVQGREFRLNLAGVARENYRTEEAGAVIVFVWQSADGTWRSRCFGDL